MSFALRNFPTGSIKLVNAVVLKAEGPAKSFVLFPRRTATVTFIRFLRWSGEKMPSKHASLHVRAFLVADYHIHRVEYITRQL
jgi:hypothetical protein